MLETNQAGAREASLEGLVEAWRSARRADDREAAVRAGQALAASGGCPVEIRLCLPWGWQRARGRSGLDALVESIGPLAVASGQHKALVAIAAARLHPASLCTADALDPSLLLFAASMAALAQGRGAEAAGWLPLCAPPTGGSALLDEVVRLQIAEPPSPSPPALPPPPAPPPPIAEAVASSLGARARSLGREGGVVVASSLVALARITASSSLPSAHPTALSLAVLAGELGRWHDGRSAAERDLASLGLALGLALSGPGESAETLARATLARAWICLEQDAPSRALELLSSLAPAARDHAPAAVRSAEGAALAALGRWDDAHAAQREALSLAERSPAGERWVAESLHWLGLGRAARGDAGGAEPLLRRALALRDGLVGRAHPERGETLVALGNTLESLGDLAGAEAFLTEAVEAFARSLGPRSERFRAAAARLAAVLLGAGRWEQAELLASQLADRARRDGAPGLVEARAWQAVLDRATQARAAGPAQPETEPGPRPSRPPPAEPSATPAEAPEPPEPGTAAPPRGESEATVDAGEPEPGVRAALARFSRGEITRHEVLRALAEHRDWHAPAELASLAREGSSPDGDRVAARPLAVFSDDEARLAAGPEAHAAPFAGGIEGHRLFARVGRTAPEVRINPGSPPAESWSLDRALLAQLAGWADAVALERALAEAPSLLDPSLLASLRDFPAFVVPLDRETEGVLTLVGAGGLANAAAVFTAPDRASAFLDRLPPESRRAVRQATMDGRSLFRFLASQRVDGLVFDCLGPRPRAAELSICDAALRVG